MNIAEIPQEWTAACPERAFQPAVIALECVECMNFRGFADIGKSDEVPPPQRYALRCGGTVERRIWKGSSLEVLP